jgi:hypothetical protein
MILNPRPFSPHVEQKTKVLELQMSTMRDPIYEEIMNNSSLESFRCWRQGFLEDVKHLLNDETRRLAQTKYSSLSRALSNAIHYLAATNAVSCRTSVRNTDPHDNKLSQTISQVARYLKDINECDPKSISYILVADEFNQCARLFSWQEAINDYLKENHKHENQGMLHALNVEISAFYNTYYIVREALQDAFVEALEGKSSQNLLHSPRTLDSLDVTANDSCDEESICILDLADSESESYTVTIHSSSSLGINKKTNLGSASTCSTSASTLPDSSPSPFAVGTSPEVVVKCLKWYGRTGQPNRQDMKRFILKEHPEISPQHIDALPWKSNGRRLDMSFMTKYLGKGSEAQFI